MRCFKLEFLKVTRQIVYTLKRDDAVSQCTYTYISININIYRYICLYMYKCIEVSARVWYYGPLMLCSSINRITPRRVSAPRRFNTMLLLSFLFVRFWIVRQFRFSFFSIPIPISWNILIYIYIGVLLLLLLLGIVSTFRAGFRSRRANIF